MKDDYEKYMLLKLYVGEDEMKKKYIEASQKHNNMVLNGDFIDAGFDLFVPNKLSFQNRCGNKIDYKIKCSAQLFDKNDNFLCNTGYYLYPRSSISKSFLRLANNVGIIDAGYRGNIMAIFDIINVDLVEVNQYERYVQLCGPGLVPIMVEVVDTLEELGGSTNRGEGGFGSTGK